jgi:hypothetical protein
METKRAFLASAALFCAAAATAAEMEVTRVYSDGRREVSRQVMEEENGVRRFRVKASDVAPGIRSIALEADFAFARKGEDGYYVFPNGHLGAFTEDSGDKSLWRTQMPMFGLKNPRETFVAIVSGMPYNFRLNLKVTNGVYRISTVFDQWQGKPYEDIAIDFYTLTGGDANYSGMARRYRQYQLGRKACRPLSDRAKGRKELAYAAAWPEIRIRQGWKPVPSPIPDQTVGNEPPMKAVVTFDRVGEIVDELKRQGVGGAELCLVGWNQKGHDGRWPQIFPVEEALGGETRLRALIKKAQDAGYQIVGHCNHRDAYIIADCWDAEYIMEKDGGTLQRPKTSWGGGRMYTICPQRAYERFATKDIPAVAALGFRGLHYLDVFTCVPAPYCTDPRHPLNQRQAVEYIDRILDLSRDTFGGIASEGSYDACAGHVDSALYVSFDKLDAPFPKLVTAYIPLWEIVYHGIILYNPFTTTVNHPVQTRAAQLKAVEFGGRPSFYFYSQFVSNGADWMGKGDLHCGTDGELRDAVSAIKAGTDEYTRLASLRYAFMDAHEQVTPGVFRTVYSNGQSVWTNYNKEEKSIGGVTIPAESYVLTNGR